MQENPNILAYVNDDPKSELSVSVGAELARLTNGQLTVLDIQGPPRVRSVRSGVAAKMSEADTISKTQRTDRIRLTAGPDATIEEIQSPPAAPHAPLIVEAAERLGASLVVKAASGKGRVGQPLFGGTALALMRQCPAPLLLATGPVIVPQPRVAAVLGLRRTGIDPMDVATLRAAATLATQLGAQLDVVCGWEAPAEGILRRYMPPSSVARSLRDERDAARTKAEKTMAEANISAPDVRLHLLRGDLRQTIPRFADSRGVDHLVLGTVSPRGLARLMRELGEDIVERWGGSILVVPETAVDISTTAAA